MDIRVLIGAENEKTLAQLSNFLTANGMTVIGTTKNSYELLRKLHTIYPDIVIVDDKMKAMYGNEVCELVIADRIAPVLSISRESEKAKYINLYQDPLFAQVVKPVVKDVLLQTIYIVLKTSKSILQLEKQVKKHKDTVDKKQLIAQAKQTLMKYEHLTEEQAHRSIQKFSMDKGLSKIKVAEMILLKYL